MLRTTRTHGILGHLHSYLELTEPKLIVWGIFLIPYVLVIIFYSGVLPQWVQLEIQKVIFGSSLALWRIFPTPTPGIGASQAMPAATDPEAITIGYFLVTYLWSCILVENFGTMRYCMHHRRWESGKKH